jgi:peptide subunit release factor 1 (eRF1)
MHSATRSVLLTQPFPAAQPNVAGIILAGSADFKTELSQSDLFDIRQA